MTNSLKFPCGCEFPIKDGKVVFTPDFNSINERLRSYLGYYPIWADTKGIFQLESFLGEHYSKKSKTIFDRSSSLH